MEIEETIKHSEVVSYQSKSSELVEIGCTLVVTGPSGEKVLHIVGPTEADPTAGFISHESPLGRAFLGKKVGDKVTVDTPAGKSVYEIVKVS